MNPKKRSLLQEMHRSWKSYLFLLPFFTLFTIFIIIPVVLAVYLSLTNFNMIQTPSFVGLSNFQNLFVGDDRFVIAMRNTLFLALITGPIGYVLAFLFAYALDSVGEKLRVVFATVFYVPSIVSGVAMSVVWKVLFANDSQGYLNSFLLRIGMINEPIQWLTDTNWINVVVILISLWMSMGSGFLSFLAGFQLINKELLEAGRIDGINSRMYELWYIIIPSMKPQLLFGAIMSVIGAFRVGDIGAQLVGFPSPDDIGLTLVLHMRDFAQIRYEMGYACAVAVVLFIIIFGVSRWCFAVLGDRD